MVFTPSCQLTQSTSAAQPLVATGTVN